MNKIKQREKVNKVQQERECDIKNKGKSSVGMIACTITHLEGHRILSRVHDSDSVFASDTAAVSSLSSMTMHRHPTVDDVKSNEQ